MHVSLLILRLIEEPVKCPGVQSDVLGMVQMPAGCLGEGDRGVICIVIVIK